MRAQDDSSLKIRVSILHDRDPHLTLGPGSVKIGRAQYHLYNGTGLDRGPAAEEKRVRVEIQPVR